MHFIVAQFHWTFCWQISIVRFTQSMCKEFFYTKLRYHFIQEKKNVLKCYFYINNIHRIAVESVRVCLDVSVTDDFDNMHMLYACILIWPIKNSWIKSLSTHSRSLSLAMSITSPIHSMIAIVFLNLSLTQP